MGTALTGPMPGYNRTPDKDERDQWTPIFVDTITGRSALQHGIRARSGRRHRASGGSSDGITSTLDRDQTRGAPGVAQPAGFRRGRLALVVHDGWGTLLGDGVMARATGSKQQDNCFAAVIAEVITHGRSESCSTS